MKTITLWKSLPIWLAVCCCLTEAWSQDLIVMTNRDTLNVIVTKNAPDVVEYKYQNESVLNVVDKSTIRRIIFSSGRVEICNEKKLPVISGAKDWEKVLVTFDSNDVAGLTECGTVEGASMSGYAVAAVEKGEIAMKRIKKSAAEKRVPIVLIVDGWNKEKNRAVIGFAGSVKLIGKAYR